MFRFIGRFILIVVIALVVLSLAAGGSVYYLTRRAFPQTSGDIHLPGLNNPVDVYRDAYGVPQVYASTSHDLFFAQGYLHAQDRFWQMDFWRHIGSGRLSEMFGKSELTTDEFLRTLGWGRVAQQELDAIDPQSKALLQAYADGVNAYLADHQGSALSLEYSILKLISPGYKVEPWTPLNSLTWAKVMAWDLGGGIDIEIRNAILLKTLSAQQLQELYPPYPSDHPVILPQFNISNTQSSAEELFTPHMASDLYPALLSLQQTASALDGLVGAGGSGIGSNSWVISGKLTATGKPLLANDPHLGEQMPSIWYEMGLHCVVKTADCPYEVTGFSFAGVPGIIIGHNDRIAWGFTNVGPAVQDLFIEKINPNNPNQYESGGAWTDMQLVKETIKIAGSQPVELTVRYTNHGPLVSDTYKPLKDFGTKAGISLPAPFALALRWTALEPGQVFQAIWRFNRAQNWDDFRQGAAFFSVPAQNLVYADVDGNIGYQTPGNIPIRKAGDGTVPVPGWTGEYDWQGYIPFDKLPYAFNPSQGFIATANNAVVGSDYPYLIAKNWDYGFRAQRIVDMITQAAGPIDIKYLQQMQGDDYDANAATLVPILTQLNFQAGTPYQAVALDLFKNWDFQNRMDSAPAALFAVFWKNLLSDTFDNKLPKDYWADGSDSWFEVMRNLVKQPNSPWWDDPSTPQKETRDDVFRQAFSSAVSEIEKALGSYQSRWSWGGLHTATFHNQSLGESGIPPIEMLFNRGPYPVSGGSSIINATAWDATNPYGVVSLPSMRMIVDLSNLQNSLTIHTTGESGHAYNPHYDDMVNLWRNIQYLPMSWDEAQIKQAPGGHLRLLP
jgi:penicillin amidase